MDINENFKTVTLTFNRDNKDLKQILIDLMRKTGKTKVDILGDALRQYNPDKVETISKTDIKEMIREVLHEEGFVKNESNESLELEISDKLNELSNKQLNNRFLEDDD